MHTLFCTDQYYYGHLPLWTYTQLSHVFDVGNKHVVHVENNTHNKLRKHKGKLMASENVCVNKTGTLRRIHVG